MKKLFILSALLIGFASAKAQVMDTLNVQFKGLSNLGASTFQLTLSWNVIDTNDYYLLRLKPAIPPAMLNESHSFTVSYFNVEGQNILEAALDSVYTYTKNKYAKP